MPAELCGYIPGQDLAMQLWKSNYTVYYMYICAHICYMLVTCVFVSGPRDMSTHDLKLPEQCPGMPGGLQTPMQGLKADMYKTQ